MDCDVVDLNRAEQAVSSLLTSNKRQEYKSRTLQEHNMARCAYLPIFPTKSIGPNDCLLLANIPGSYFDMYLLLIFSFYDHHLAIHLAPHEILRREHGAYTSDALMMMNNYNYSNDSFQLSYEDAEALATRLHVGKSIITFNADRLRGICYSLLAHHESFRRNVLQQSDVALKEPTFNSQQMSILLEFYLQIDGKLIYMPIIFNVIYML